MTFLNDQWKTIAVQVLPPLGVLKLYPSSDDCRAWRQHIHSFQQTASYFIVPLRITFMGSWEREMFSHNKLVAHT